jgi:CRP-like cAMP-binding protein
MAETPAQVAFGLASLLNPLLNPSADCKVRISQEELGKLCGLSRQIVSGALRRLQLAGVVSLEYGGVRVLDVPALNRFAGVICQ